MNIDFCLSCEIARPPDESATWLFNLESIKVSHHSTKFGGPRHCDNGDVLVLVYHGISQEYVIKWLCDFIGRSQSRQVTIVQSLVAIMALVTNINSTDVKIGAVNIGAMWL